MSRPEQPRGPVSTGDEGHSGKPVVAVLSFHKIGHPPAGRPNAWFYIPEDVFAAQLDLLRTEGWHVIGLPRFLTGLESPGSLPARAVLLTFDDGYSSLCESALPWLRRFRYPAVVFVPSDFIGGRNSFDEEVEPEEAICSWDRLRLLAQNDVSIQSHGVSHQRFSGLSATTLEQELRESKRLLEAGLGAAVEALAFPYGDGGVDPALTTRLLETAGYRAAFLYGGGAISMPPGNSYRLDRVAMGPDTDLRAALTAACL